MQRSPKQMVIAVAAIALVARIGGMLLSQHLMPVIASDTVFYTDIAQNLANGNGYRTTESVYEASRVPPVFPLALALLMLFSGPDVPIVWIGIMNAILRTIAVAALFMLARRYFGGRAAFVAALLYIVDPWETMWVGYLLKDSMGVAMFVLAILALARADEERSPRWFAFAGAMIAVATLTRWAHGALLFVGLALIFMRGADAKRRRAANALAICAAMLIVLAPWLVRNWRVIGQPVLSPHFVGQKLYTSNGPGVERVTDGYYAPKRPVVRERDAPRDPKRPIDRDVALGRMTIRHLIENPSEIPLRLGSKIVNMWRPTFASHSRRNLVMLALPYVVLMLLSIAGMILARRDRVHAPAITATLVVFLLVHLVFRGEIRNRQYLMPLLYAFGGYAVARPPTRSGRQADGPTRPPTRSGRQADRPTDRPATRAGRNRRPDGPTARPGERAGGTRSPGKHVRLASGATGA